jgi:putative DNA primase/helicase
MNAIAEPIQIENGDRPLILLEPANPHLAADEGIKAVMGMPGAPVIFQRGGLLVHIAALAPATARQKAARVTDRQIVPVTRPLLSELLAQAAIWRQMRTRRKKDKDSGQWSTTDEWIVVPPPRQIAEAILARDQWDFPALTGVIAHPTLRPDFSLLDEPGYDPRTGLYADF